MKRRAPALLLAAALALAGTVASAAIYRVDDTGTVVSQPITPMRWRQLVPGRGADNTVEGHVTVAVRLNLGPWLGQRARLYLVLAPTEGGQQLQASWRTLGRLLPGQLRSGDRAVVFDGLVTQAFLQESLQLELTADGRTLEQAQPLRFHFEIEVGL